MLFVFNLVDNGFFNGFFYHGFTFLKDVLATERVKREEVSRDEEAQRYPFCKVYPATLLHFRFCRSSQNKHLNTGMTLNIYNFYGTRFPEKLKPTHKAASPALRILQGFGSAYNFENFLGN